MDVALLSSAAVTSVDVALLMSLVLVLVGPTLFVFVVLSSATLPLPPSVGAAATAFDRFTLVVGSTDAAEFTFEVLDFFTLALVMVLLRDVEEGWFPLFGGFLVGVVLEPPIFVVVESSRWANVAITSSDNFVFFVLTMVVLS